MQVPPFRLDYALGNAHLRRRRPECSVVQTPDTDVLSDHYPIECRWAFTEDEPA
jgi:endonuclease/exonuclease/phosphatase family metal-dependent hydrolase